VDIRHAIKANIERDLELKAFDKLYGKDTYPVRIAERLAILRSLNFDSVGAKKGS
jgi:hypothetical protein